jgi:signal transduction histidine kinase
MAASMAHEIRNPLTAIEGFIQLIRTEMNSPNSLNLSKVNGFIDIIQNEFSGLYGQITSFLSFSKNDGLVEPYVLCTGKRLIESVLELVNPRLINENIQVKLGLPCGKPLAVQKTAIQQVLSNLLNNSIDALSTVSYPKMIAIRTYDDDANYYIEVIDNGPGIPAEIQDTVFTPFVTGKVNGTGLGLAICKQIMKKNKGDIRFISKQGETKFTLSLAKTNP